MKPNQIIDLTQYRNKVAVKRRRKKDRKKGSVYCRGGKLWVDFYYLGERVREPTGLNDTKENRKTIRKQLDLIIAEIDNDLFEFANRFPNSSKKNYYSQLEGKQIKIMPNSLKFKDYQIKWLNEMKSGMSITQLADYNSIINYHLIPHFGEMDFNEILNPICLKKFIAKLKGIKNRYNKPLSGKRIQNILIPLRVIVRDAIDEYGWHEYPDPFIRLKLPKAKKLRVYPFRFDEWETLMQFIPSWYQNYFEFAVQTGLRPSEQVALKWSAIDDEYIHIELSRVKNREKQDMKTDESRRMIQIRPTLRKILDRQWEQTKEFQSPYVFINNFHRPVLQDKARAVWERAMKKSGLKYRRMYETRHTFASWALAAGETPEWVARTLGHVNTSMIYKTYSRYIANLKRNDGTALERLYLESTNSDGTDLKPVGHNYSHNAKNQLANIT